MTRHALARRQSYINRQKRKSDAEVVQLPYNVLYLINIFGISGRVVQSKFLADTSISRKLLLRLSICWPAPQIHFSPCKPHRTQQGSPGVVQPTWEN